MVQLLTWEWLARDILFQLANDRCIGLPWRRSGRVMVYWMSRDTTTIWDWDWTAWESPRPVHCIHTSRAFVSTSGLKKEFKGKREIDPVFPCHPLPPRSHELFQWSLKTRAEIATRICIYMCMCMCRSLTERTWQRSQDFSSVYAPVLAASWWTSSTWRTTATATATTTTTTTATATATAAATTTTATATTTTTTATATTTTTTTTATTTATTTTTKTRKRTIAQDLQCFPHLHRCTLFHPHAFRAPSDPQVVCPLFLEHEPPLQQPETFAQHMLIKMQSMWESIRDRKRKYTSCQKRKQHI